jgi:hypothetical protein
MMRVAIDNISIDMRRLALGKQKSVGIHMFVEGLPCDDQCDGDGVGVGESQNGDDCAYR